MFLGFVHRDVKLANFMLGKNSEDQIYVIDLGLVKKIFKSNGQMFPVCFIFIFIFLSFFFFLFVCIIYFSHVLD
jgi:serine/threonine protein kinase